MPRRVPLACLLALALAAATPSAPAPLAPPAVADALVGLRDRATPAEVQKRLRSRDFLAAVLRDDAVRRLGVQDIPDPEAWLAARLRIHPLRGGTALRIGLADCTVAEALTLLSAVAERYLDDVFRDRPEKLRNYSAVRDRLSTYPRGGMVGWDVFEAARNDRLLAEMIRSDLDTQKRLILRGPRSCGGLAR